MPLKLLIIPDKFKGTLTAEAVAQAIASGWRKVRPTDKLELLPLSDGGDGFGEVIGRLLEAETCTIDTVDAAHRPCLAQWWWVQNTKTAIIESAKVIGLAQLPPGQFHPFQLDTFGMGAVLMEAKRKGAQRCLVGIGGSATNDAGFGMARALGWRFFDRKGNLIEQWSHLSSLTKLCPPRSRRLFRKLIVAVDVQNPLLGTRGATRIFGPQKGLKKTEFAEAEKNLRHLATVFAQSEISGTVIPTPNRLHPNLHAVPGAGAAGGLGFGFMAFLGAKLEPGFALFARLAKLDRRLRTTDLVITGEGMIDRSTVMGKGVGEIARRCRKLNVPCIALAGTVSPSPKLAGQFKTLHALTELTSEENAKARPSFWLKQLAARVASEVR